MTVPVVLCNIFFPLGHVEHNLDDALLYWFGSQGLHSGRPSMGANVFRGHVSQDVGRLLVTRVSLLCFPTAQNSHVPFAPVEALKNVPAGQHTTRPKLPSKALSAMMSTQLDKHQMWVKASAFLNMSAVLITFAVFHLVTSELNAVA